MNRKDLQTIITKVPGEAINFLARALENEKFSWNAVLYEKNYMLAEEMVKQNLPDYDIIKATHLSRKTIYTIRKAYSKS